MAEISRRLWYVDTIPGLFLCIYCLRLYVSFYSFMLANAITADASTMVSLSIHDIV
jgi:hypothetical protein